MKRGGERAYLDTADILAKHDHDLAFFAMENPHNRPSRWSRYFVSASDYEAGFFDIFKNIKAILNIWYNFEAKRKLEKLIKYFKPDVAHLHNIYHQLSPSVIDVLKKYKIPIVMTLHDYKLISPAYNLSVRGRIWEKDKGAKLYKCLIDRVVKDSFFKSLVCVIEAYLHKFLKIYEKVDLFISPSTFLIGKFREYGFKGKMVKLPNPLVSDQIEEVSEEKDFILYYGGLSSEKGVEDLFRAIAIIDRDIRLKVIGEGLEKEKLISLSQKLGLTQVDFLGFQNRSKIFGYLDKSLFLVVPSRCYENAPYTILEAMSRQKAIIAPRLGGIEEMIEDEKTGLLYEPGDITDLSEKIKILLSNRELASILGKAGKESLSGKYLPDNYYQGLLKAYQEVVRKSF
jgi:glycosyltransferase involved in cell wall biosynthesis